MGLSDRGDGRGGGWMEGGETDSAPTLESHMLRRQKSNTLVSRETLNSVHRERRVVFNFIIKNRIPTHENVKTENDAAFFAR